MKRILLLLLTVLAFAISANAQSAIAIYGTVTNSVTGNPIPNHPVSIHSDSLTAPFFQYWNTKTTDANGFYIDTIAIPSNVALTFYASLLDCQNQYHSNTITVNANGTYTGNPANFAICSASTPSCTASFYGIDSISHMQFYGSANTTVASWSWNFGDGTSGSGQNPTHTYAQAGVYTVCLTTVDTNLCTATYCDSIYYSGGVITPCQSSFGAADSGGFVFFWGNSNTQVVSWSWNFDDGTFGSGQYPNHSYAQPGVYIVCLTTVDINNCTSTYCDSLNITSVVGTNCQSTYTSFDTAGTRLFLGSSNTSVVSWTWDFGDGSSGTGQYATHTYAQAGTYIACLTTVDNNNCTSVFCDSVVIQGSNPTCQSSFAVFDSSGTYYFFGSSNTQVVSWSWDFGDGNTSNLQYPTHIYTNSGTYIVCLTTVDNNNCTSVFCDSVQVSIGPATCTATFSAYPDTTVVPYNGAYYFAGWATPAQNNFSYYWDFGDGGIDSVQYPNHVYPMNGTYVACLTVTDLSTNCTATYCDSVVVSGIGSIQRYAMSGNVTMSGAAATQGMVWLVQLNTSNNTLTAIDSTALNTLGAYSFNNLLPGTYMVKAALSSASPSFTSYMPTYLGNNLYWSTASTINLTQNSISQNVSLVAGTNPGGPGFISGSVLQGANKRDPGDPIEGVTILLLDNNDNPVTYVYTDATGAFEFNNLAYGTYKIYAEVLNKSTDPAIVDISAASPTSSNTVVEINSTDITHMSTGITYDYFGENNRVYPNPVTQAARLELSLKQSAQIDLNLRNALGQAVWSKSELLGSGTHQIELDMNDLPAGVYFIQMKADKSEQSTLKVIKW